MRDRCGVSGRPKNTALGTPKHRKSLFRGPGFFNGSLRLTATVALVAGSLISGGCSAKRPPRVLVEPTYSFVHNGQLSPLPIIASTTAVAKSDVNVIRHPLAVQ